LNRLSSNSQKQEADEKDKMNLDKDQLRQRERERRDMTTSRQNENNNKLPKCHPFPLQVPSSVPYEVHSSPQIVIAHRGSSAHLPEHSLPSYRLALELGADYIEPDLVSTKDHHLVAMHSLDLSVTTNVDDVFGSTKNKTISKYKDGETGYWVFDFTLEEIKRLRLTQRLSDRSIAFDGIFQIPTLSEILQLLDEWNQKIQPLWYNSGNDEHNDAFIISPSSSMANTTTTTTTNDNKNNNNNKKQQRHYYPPPPRGLYAELKDFPWLLEDANIDLLDLFFDHLTINETTSKLWNKALLRHMCDTKLLKEHEYRLPPLVIQSFEAEVLRKFTLRWENIAAAKGSNDNDNDNDNNNKSVLTFEVPAVDHGGNISIPLPTPPTILLVSDDKCRDETFWFEIENNYRAIISGIGPDKRCFFQTISPTSGEKRPMLQYLPILMEKSKKFSWVVHPWTERPENNFFVTTANTGENRKERSRQRRQQVVSTSNNTKMNFSPFTTVIDELLFMKCTVGVHGIFSESVDIAVRVMNMPCPAELQINGKFVVVGGVGGSNDLSSSSSDATPSCSTEGKDDGGCGSGIKSIFNMDEIPLGPVILFSFISGILTALVVWKYCLSPDSSSSSNAQRRRRRSQRQSHSAIPTDIIDDDIDIDIDIDNNNHVHDENDHEML